MGNDGDWVYRLGWAPEDTGAARTEWERRRRSNMRPGETLAAARKRWRSKAVVAIAGKPLIENGREGGARCASCRAGAGANGGRRARHAISWVSLLNG